MSILAEPRRKQRISIDPQNLTWKNDDQKFSKKLMEKMGWSEGDGLGRNRQGNQDAIKLKANTSGRGLGADKMNDYDSTWISHHDDFADLLAALNKNKEAEPEQTEEEKNAAAEKISIELKSKSVKRRIHYQKFTRAKDTSNYSENDKTAILGFGKLKKDKNVVAEEEKEIKKEDEDEKSDDKKEGIHTVSTMSVGDYFAAKMAALKAKRESTVAVKTEIKEEIVEGEEETDEAREARKAEKRERKRLRREQRAREQEETIEIKTEIKEEVIDEEIDEAERKRLKKEKKRLKRLHEEQQQNEENVEEEEDVPKKRKKYTEADE
ncbi:unnamed protein product [Caenorhabditis angaria]|uniref:G-patch domain-containing protein n=1 Tax=Caenorhabditis angaria TaxID=860376 RepID=A0A9P1MVB6_9PELO|nr:unnamed protein product [Caenorhabditis angaria]